VLQREPVQVRNGISIPGPLRAIAVIGLVAVLCVAPAHAQAAKKWVQASEADFAAGKSENLAITTIGELRLGRRLDTLSEKAGDHVWAMAIDSNGVVYAGTGSGGEILKIAGGKCELFYKSEEPEVTSIAVDKAGNVYAGTAPNGLIYRFSPNAEPVVLFDSDASYIWGLAFDSKGTLYAATGDKAKVLKITEPGKAETIFETKDPHILDMVVDGKDNIYVCTNKSGLVFRIDPAGKAFAVFDSEDEEMHALAVDDANNVYVCTADGMQPGSANFNIFDERDGTMEPKQPGPAAGKEEADGDDEFGEDEGDGEGDEPQKEHQRPGPRPIIIQPSQALQPDSAAPPINGINFVYKITPDGMVTSLFRREGMAILSMAWHQGSIYLGTANLGQVLQLDENLQVTGHTQVEPMQVSALVAAPDGALFLGTSTEGRIYRLDGKLASEGTFRSIVKDMTYPSQWGVLRSMGDFPGGASASVATRSGNMAEPDKTWSDWSGEQNLAPAGVKIASPPARFLQYRIRMKGGNDSMPVLRSVEVYYLPPNYRPRITAISFPRPPDGQGPPMPSMPPSRGAMEPPKSPTKPLRGQVEVAWQAEDANNDALKFEVFIRGEGEAAWKSLADKLREPRFLLSTMRLPDGVYRIKVKADDEPANPPGRSMTTEEVTEPFVIDNSAPAVTVKAKVEGDRTVSVTAELADTASPIEDAAYSVDAGKWILLSADDGILDSLKETVSLKTDALEPGEHTVTINVRDAAGNIGAGKAVVVVP